MSHSPEVLKKQIADIETALEMPLPDAARQQLEASLISIRQHLTLPNSSTHQNKDSHAHSSNNSVDGRTDVSGTLRGAAIGVNQGTVQLFFGAQVLGDANELLNSYLNTLINEHGILRLGKLLGKQQTGRTRSPIPSIPLRNVYTSLATDNLIEESSFSLDAQSIRKGLLNGDPSKVLPDRVRLPILDGVEQHRRSSVNVGQQPVQGMTGFLTEKWNTQRRLLPKQEDYRKKYQGRWSRPELAVETIARSASKTILLGDPGSGKSTVLRYLLVLIADALLSGRTTGLDLRGWEQELLPLPVFCQLGTVSKLFNDNPDHDLETLLNSILSSFDGSGMRKGLQHNVLNSWRKGNILLCFDGLDEVSSLPENTYAGKRSHRERITDAIVKLAQHLNQSRMIITCRVKPYYQDTSWQFQHPWKVRTIEPFAFGQVRHFISAWYTQTCLNPDIAKYTTSETRERATDLINALSKSPGLHAIANSPLLLTMLILLHYNQKQLPDERAEVYEELVKLLLDRWEGVRSSDKDQREFSIGQRLGLSHLRVDHLRPPIHELAFEAHRQAIDGRGVITEKLFEETLDKFFSREINPDNPKSVSRSVCAQKTEILGDLLTAEAGLVQPDGDDSYVFPHLTFEEYLAACHLSGRGDMKLAYDQWCKAGERWREVILLLMGRLRHQEKFDLIFGWISLLMSDKESIERRQADVLLAASCYENIGKRRYLLSYIPESSVLSLERQIYAELLSIVKRPSPKLSILQRIEAGQTLGQLGDPRLPITVEEWSQTVQRRSNIFSESEEYWCYVRPGTYKIGGWKPYETGDMVTLPSVWIARFPVTVSQLAQFVKGGYNNSPNRFWTPNGLKWKEKHSRPKLWKDTQYSGANQPVVGVSWYEAVAFASWLTEQLKDVLPEGYLVRLPTDAEWEVAAAYDVQMQRHKFPWGSERITSERAIFNMSSLGGPAPVGTCPAGATACGALDMIGNTWEWMSSSHSNYPLKSNQPLRDFVVTEQNISRRGGGWWDNEEVMHCDVRRKTQADGVGIYGFRLALTSSL